MTYTAPGLGSGRDGSNADPGGADGEGHLPRRLPIVGVIRIGHAQTFLSPVGEQEPGYHAGGGKS